MVSQTSQSMQESENQNIQDCYDSNQDPFSSSRQLYEHSVHVKSIESHTSDDYDNEGTSRKKKREQEYDSIDQANRAEVKNFKNMFNDPKMGDFFSIKRSMPTTQNVTLIPHDNF
jgi:hypothetical protein